MKSKIAIYLAGSIKKGHEKTDETYWTDADMRFIRQSLNEYEISFLNPAFRTDDLSNNRSVFGRDMVQVFSSNVVFVDARNRRGLGVGAEMMWAKLNKIPVVTWAPMNSHYHKSKTTILDVPVENFIHPFVESLSDKIVENLAEGTEWIHTVLTNSSIEIKGLESINSAMNHYKETQLHNDTPMQDLLAASEVLQKRMQRAHPNVRFENHFGMDKEWFQTWDRQEYQEWALEIPEGYLLHIIREEAKNYLVVQAKLIMGTSGLPGFEVIEQCTFSTKQQALDCLEDWKSKKPVSSHH